MDNTADNMLLERYRYILDQKKSLNETTFKITALYQGLISAAIAGHVLVVHAYEKKELSKQTFTRALETLAVGVAGASVFAIALLVGGILSWYGYRAEEQRFEKMHLNIDRDLPSWRSWFKWYEIWIILAIVATAVAYLGLMASAA